MTFSLGDYGAVFSTGSRGTELREELLTACITDGELRISFAGVQSISYSFADEFLGPLMLGSPNRVVLEDVPPSLRRILIGTIRRRGIRTSERKLFDSVAA